MFPKINKTVLMSGADYFGDQFAINALMNSSKPVDRTKAMIEHQNIREALESAGVKVIKVDSPPDLQDGVYTANWALVHNGKALLSRLPNQRKGEETYAYKYLQAKQLNPVILPKSIKCFSGQGDTLACGDIVFAQSPYRTSIEAHPFLKSVLGFNTVLSLKTKPSRWFKFGPTKKNKITGWPDSPTYDLDLAIAILSWPSGYQKGLIGWCPSVFTRHSRKIIREFDEVEKVEVSKQETLEAYALNLVSTGEVVIMNAGAPEFQSKIKARGLKTITLNLPELKKGGGSIRCTTLTLEN